MSDTASAPLPSSSSGETASSGGASLLHAVLLCWALLFGMGLVMLGTGLQSTLLGVRSILEGFPPGVTGIIQSGYFAGFAVGSLFAPGLVARVGHVRVFAALASVASIAVLLHTLYVDPVVWTAMRILTGFSFAGLVVVAESWLNYQSQNETRGQMLSIYMVVCMAGMGAGPLLLNIADPGGFVLFVVVSVLVSAALVPILLTVGGAPPFEAPEKMSLRELYHLAPLGMVGMAAAGMSNGALVGVAAVYAQEAGLSRSLVSIFVSVALIGVVVIQWPVGRLSDRYDRRKVMTAVTLLAAGVAAVALVLTPGTPAALAAAAGLGGLSFSMYSLAVAQTNDRVPFAKMVGASSTLVLMSGLGSTVGTLSAGFSVEVLGPQGFFLYFVVIHVALGLYAAWRVTKRDAVPAEDQAPAVYLGGSYATSAVATVAAVEVAEEAYVEQQAEAAEAAEAAEHQHTTD